MVPACHVGWLALLQMVQLPRGLSSSLLLSVQLELQLVHCPLQVVIRYLSEAGWPYRVEPQNPGVLLVNIGGPKRF